MLDDKDTRQGAWASNSVKACCVQLGGLEYQGLW